MMNGMRKNMKAILWVVVIAFVGTIFFVWGMDIGRRKDFAEQTSAAVVNDQPISYEDFGRAWEQESRQLYNRGNADPAPAEVSRLRRRVAQALIDRVLLQQQYRQLKLTVSPQEVAARIAGINAFSENGRFSQAKYLQLLQANRISPQDFEAEQRALLELTKMELLVRQSVLATEPQLRQFFLARSRQLRFAYVSFAWQDRAKSVQVPEDEVRAYFQKHRAEYDQPAEVRASHILVGVDAKATEEQKLTAKLKLENIRNEIVKGLDFAEAAQKYSQDPGSAKQGGDLGFFRTGMMVPAFEKAAFALKAGELSQPVESPFGYHLIKVTGRHEEKKASLEAARPKIVKLLQEEKARQTSLADSLKYLTALVETKDVQTAAKQTQTPVNVSGWVTLKDKLPGLEPERAKELMDRVFDLPLNTPSSALPAGDGIYYVQVLEEKNQPFDEARFAAERDGLAELYNQRLSDQVFDAYLTHLRRTNRIVNNIEKEGQENEGRKN